MEKVAITGAAGRLGKRVVAECRDAGIGVVAVDRVPSADLTLDAVMELHDLERVRETFAGCEGVIHLAAIPAPGHVPDDQLFANNTQSTYAVLNAATAAGVRSIVLASSASIYGMSWAPRPLSPAYVPIDEQHPLNIHDTYALTKQVDECTAAMLARLHPECSVVALRLQWVATTVEIREMAARLTVDPTEQAQNLWSYVEAGDAARACRLALTAPAGFHVVNVCAAETLCKVPTEELVRTYHPQTKAREPLPGTATPWAMDRAYELFGFQPEWSLE
jgi:nucleoside-diphosphate-sugar epimerase